MRTFLSVSIARKTLVLTAPSEQPAICAISHGSRLRINPMRPVAQKVHPIAALQTEYSLWTRDPEAELLPLCRDTGITFVAYSPLGRGFLTGQIKRPQDVPDDYRKNMPRLQDEHLRRNLELAQRVEEIATEKGWNLYVGGNGGATDVGVTATTITAATTPAANKAPFNPRKRRKTMIIGNPHFLGTSCDLPDLRCTRVGCTRISCRGRRTSRSAGSSTL